MMTAPCVLIVHDARAAREAIARALPPGFGCEVALKPDEVGEKMRVAAPDVVVLELRSAGSDRFAELTRIRSEHPAVPVVLAAARGGIGDAVEAIKRGASNYLVEPWDEADLRAAIEGAVAARRGPRPASQRKMELVGSGPAM